MTLPPEQIAAVVLAGGEGRRIGGDKPLRLLAGRRLIDHALAQAGAASDCVVTVVRDPAQAARLGLVEWRLDAPWPGPLGGLASALAFARDAGRAAVLTLPCDMPLLPADLAPRMARTIGSHTAVVAAGGGLLHPVCALWRTEALDALGPYAASGRLSLKGFAAQVGHGVAEWPTTPADPFFNVNTAEELAEAARRLA